MRRWNGWGDESIVVGLEEPVLDLLRSLVGPGSPISDATLHDVVAAISESRVGPDPRLGTDAADRVRHARGQSFPDWVALRTGRLGPVPDAVARPPDRTAVRELFELARRTGSMLIPFGGGTSVVGGLTPPSDGRPSISVDLGRAAGLRALDPLSGLATVGAGTTGPDLEAALAANGVTLGHRPQSWEYSTVGGWVATRSSGQESLGYGRIEALFAGGVMEAPAGSLVMPPHPASAAGPDIRQVVLGSEGRLGIVTDVTVRTARMPERDGVAAFMLPDWERALEAARSLARSRLALTMVRVSTPLETATTFGLAGHRRSVAVIRRYARARGIGPEGCLVLVGTAGAASVVRAIDAEVRRLMGRSGGVGIPRLGAAWRRDRFRAPYLRNTLWEAGYGVDTLETATTWSGIDPLASAIGRALRHGLEDAGERVHAFSHLSHVYPTGSSLYTTYVFRLAADPEETLERWRRLKGEASATIVEHGATISHQHGVGRDHAPYLPAEKDRLGMDVIRDAISRFDPDGLLARGVLIEDGP